MNQINIKSSNNYVTVDQCSHDFSSMKACTSRIINTENNIHFTQVLISRPQMESISTEPLT